MSNFWNNFVAGVIAGLVVALFVLVMRAIWQRLVIPWFEDRVYKDARIEGPWFSLYPLDVYRRQETISLSRHGHYINGTISCTNGPDAGEQYEISGSFRNMILPLIYETSDPSKTDRGTITLKLEQNARQFTGVAAAYHTHEDSIQPLVVQWFRSKKAVEDFISKLDAQKQELEQLRKQQKALQDAKRSVIQPESNKSPEIKIPTQPGQPHEEKKE
jgi:hypothetical protein